MKSESEQEGKTETHRHDQPMATNRSEHPQKQWKDETELEDHESGIELRVTHQEVLSQKRPRFVPRKTDHEEFEHEIDAGPCQIGNAQLDITTLPEVAQDTRVGDL